MIIAERIVIGKHPQHNKTVKYFFSFTHLQDYSWL